MNKYFNVTIPFFVGDAQYLTFDDHLFDGVRFSFNGLMSIPGKENRLQALKEIHRVLKINGIFIFTTYDREQNPEYLDFWKMEQLKWEQGTQDPRLLEFGDIIAPSKNEEVDIYLHIPNQEEIMGQINIVGFAFLESFYRDEFFDENLHVKAISGECRFWIIKKSG